MMDKDSQLIFEGYLNSRNDILLEADGEEKSGFEQAKDWMIFIGKVLDPTGISSYPDLIDAFKKYETDQSITNFVLLILNFYAALPNLGLLAAGVGGIGWGALKASAKAAIKSGGKEAAPIASKILSLIKGSKELKYALSKVLDSLVKNKSIDQKGASVIMSAIEKGGTMDWALAKGVEKAIADVGSKEVTSATKEYLKKDAPFLLRKASVGDVGSKAGIAQLGIRAAKDIGETEYPTFMPKMGGTKEKPIPTPQAKGQRPSSTMRTEEPSPEKSLTKAQDPSQIPTGESRFARKNLGK